MFTYSDLGSTWPSVVSEAAVPLYPQRIDHRHPWDKRRDVSQSRSGSYEEEKIRPYKANTCDSMDMVTASVA
jgi:hypothetical protein